MKIAFLTLGSRGDVEPFSALAEGAMLAGHSVVLGAPGDAEARVRDRGIPFVPLGIDFQAVAESPRGRNALGGRPSAVLRLVGEARTALGAMLRAAWEASAGADAVVYHPKVLGGAHIAEALGKPGFASLPLPLLVPTSEFPAPLGALRNLGPLNRATYGVTRLASLPFAGILKRWRLEVLGLPTRADPLATEHVLYAFSRHLVPRPADWAARVHVTGYWFAEPEAGYAPPERLARFLDRGPPPVYIGFGSMAARDPARTTRVVLDAVRRADVRAVLATGWGGLEPGEVPDDVLPLQSVPHDWLFPRCAAVVHHGGSGTTHAGLRAGRPTVICPFAMDQFFWGARTHALGAGPEPIPQRTLGAASLAAALRAAVEDTEIARHAADLGAAIRGEDGVATALGIIESAAGRGAARAR